MPQVYIYPGTKSSTGCLPLKDWYFNVDVGFSELLEEVDIEFSPLLDSTIRCRLSSFSVLASVVVVHERDVVHGTYYTLLLAMFYSTTTFVALQVLKRTVCLVLTAFVCS